MDGRGRALDNISVERLWRSVKYKDVYLKGYGIMCELTLGLTEYFTFYNRERPHQSLTNQTPAQIYKSSQGSGVLILDKYPKKEVQKPCKRGSAVQLRMWLKALLKLIVFLSGLRGLLLCNSSNDLI